MRSILGDGPAGELTRLGRHALRDRHFSNGGLGRTHVGHSHLRHLCRAVRCRGRRPPDILFILIRVGSGSLLVAFVEVQQGIDLGLAREQRNSDLKIIADQQGHGMRTHLDKYVQSGVAERKAEAAKLYAGFSGVLHKQG